MPSVVASVLSSPPADPFRPPWNERAEMSPPVVVPLPPFAITERGAERDVTRRGADATALDRDDATLGAGAEARGRERVAAGGDLAAE